MIAALLPLICGVRPNSPIHTIRVVSSRPRCLQVFHQRRPGRIQHPAELLDGSNLLMCVSQPSVTCHAAERDFDERHAALDQPPGQQTALAEQVAAVAIAQLLWLVFQIESLARRRAH